MILFEGVSKEYRLNRRRSVLALKNINFHVEKGEFISIIGPSGSGKSTFLALASLLERQSAGEIVINEKTTTSMKEYERTRLRYELCGYIFQFASLMPDISIIDNVMLPLLLMGKKRSQLEERALEMLEQVGIKNDQATKLPYQLSGGEQRRVAAARALLKEPLLLFADEPTAALDDETAADLLGLFHQFHQKGTTILMVTHNKEIAKGGTRLLEIRDGELK